jgi:hypothetical protein
MIELQQYYSWIVERFHISTQAFQLQARGKAYDFRWLEERLLPLNFWLILCTRSAGSFGSARRQHLKVSGNPSQCNDLTALAREQELMCELVARSLLPCLTLDISDNDVPASVERVADWLERTGGLYMPDRPVKAS